MTLPVDQLSALFASVTRSVWRWECQGHYEVDEAELARWRAGLPSELDTETIAWHDYIRGLRRRAIPFQRVRMITEPATEYLIWLMTTTDANIDAGEDIRWVHESVARDLGLPEYDYYLVDDERVAIMRFDAEYTLVDVKVTTQPDVVAQHRRWRDLVWHHAVQHRELHLT